MYENVDRVALAAEHFEGRIVYVDFLIDASRGPTVICWLFRYTAFLEFNATSKLAQFLLQQKSCTHIKPMCNSTGLTRQRNFRDFATKKKE